MALATKCPHCGTTFRVASDQLKLRGGIVRCGSCQQIFDANASLVDLDVLAPASSAPAPAPQAVPPAQQTPEAAEPAPAAPAAHEQDIPVYTVDFDSTLHPLGILPQPEPSCEPEDPAQPGLLIVDVASPGEPGAVERTDEPALADEPRQAELAAGHSEHEASPAKPTNTTNVVPAQAGTHAEAALLAAPMSTDPALPTTEGETVAEPEPLGEDVAPEPPGENVEPEPLGEDVEPEPLGEDVEPEPLGEDVEPEPPGENEEPALPGEDAAPEPLGDSAEPEPSSGEAEPDQPVEDLAQEEPAREPEPEPPVDAAPASASQPRSEPRQVFSMGSALLSEPGHAPHAERAGRVEPTLHIPVDEELVAAPPPVDHAGPADDLHAEAEAMARFAAEHTPLPLRESADGGVYTGAVPPPAKGPRSRLPGRRSKLTPTRIAPPKLRVPEIDEPDFVKRGRQKEQTGKQRRILMASGSVVLALVLAAQSAYTFRNDLAARFPATKPALAGLCTLLGCRVELPARIENLTIETGELQTVGANTYMLTTLLHNQAGMAQAWPAIELALTDANDKPLLRRVFVPGEYLPKGALPAAGFGAHAEQPVKLYFQLDQLKPAGYHIAIFYP